MSKALQITLGILTAIGGMIDIGNLVANPQAGGRFGMSLAWVIVLAAIGIIVFAEMSGRIATVSHRPVFDLVRERLGPQVALVNLLASFGLTVLTLIAEIAGTGLILQLATGINYLYWIPVIAIMVWLVAWRMPFETMERVYGLMGLAMLVVMFTVFKLHPDWHGLTHEALHPRVPTNESYATFFYFAIAQLGSVMTPYQVFFFSSGAVEEKWSTSDLVVERGNIYVGFPLGTLIALSLMAGGAIVFESRGVQVQHLSQTALPTVLAFGRVGLALLILGMFAAVFGAALETALSSGYAVAQYLGWQWGKMVKPDDAPRFHLVVLLTIIVAAAAGLTTVDPIKVTELVVVLSAAALPLTFYPVLVVANDPEYMGEHANSPLMNAFAYPFLVLLVIVSLATVPLMYITKLGG
jgi:Mn2+/Fe2+ NRAMP family transporter